MSATPLFAKRASQTSPGLFTLIAFLLAPAGAAKADITICNDFGATVHVALAYPDHDDYAASGWWTVEPRACKPAEFAFQGTELYYTADSNQYKAGRATKTDHWGDKLKLFVSRKDFKSDAANQRRAGAKPEMFGVVQVARPNPASNPTITFHFKPGGTSINVKTSP